MILHAPNLNALWADLLIEELIRSGVDFFCLASGSRSAPLTTAVASRSQVKTAIHFDERGAAFLALGYARATGRPAVVITTSGTAVANVWPAVVEASEDRLPMIVLSADRPPELHEAGANQTIDQAKIFGHYVRWQIDLPCPTREIRPEAILTAADQAVYRSRRPPQGPVHLNCMFREPLAPVSSGEDYREYVSALTKWQQGGRPYTDYSPSVTAADNKSIRDLARMLSGADRGLLVVGALRNIEDQEAARRLSAQLGWPTLPDITSGLRLGAAPSQAIPYYDLLLGATQFAEAHVPDTALHLGGRLTSKRLLDYLERSRPAEYIIVDDHPFRYDPVHLASLRIETAMTPFCDSLHSLMAAPKRSPWLSAWRLGSEQVGEALASFAARSPALSEPLVARLISQEIGAQCGLFLASSMPIRDMNAFGSTDGARARVAANRGASGIDGALATAAGFAQGLDQAVTALIGDLALLHDLNSLSLVGSLGLPVMIVVLNNNGGGIFSFLPIAQFDDVFERFFGTPHNLNFEGAARMFGLEYVRPSSRDAFVEAYRAAAKRRKSILIEVMTERRENFDLHVHLQKEIAARLSNP